VIRNGLINTVLKSGYELYIVGFFLVLLNINFFLDRNKPEIMILVLALSIIVFFILLLYKKELLLYIICFSVPLTVPITIFPGSELNFPSETMAVILAVYLCVRFCIKYRADKVFLRHPITVLLLIDLLWLLTSSAFSMMPEVSFKRFIIRLIYILTYYVFFYELFRLDKKNITRVFFIHCLGLILPILHTIDVHADYRFSTTGASMAAQPFYNDHTIYGAALVFVIPFLVYNSFFVAHKPFMKWVGYGLLAFISLAAFLSYSRAALASLIITGVISLLIWQKIKMIYVVAGLVMCLGIAAFFQREITDYMMRTRQVSHKNDLGMHFRSLSNVHNDDSNIERINRWKCAWRMFLDKPLAGFGPGTYQFFYGKYQVRKDMTIISTFAGDKGHAHSEYLGYLSETGFPGFLNFLLLAIIICIRSLTMIYKTPDKEQGRMVTFVFLGLVTYFIHGIFNGFIESDKIAMPVFVSLAAITALDIHTRKEVQEN